MNSELVLADKIETLDSVDWPVLEILPNEKITDQAKYGSLLEQGKVFAKLHGKPNEPPPRLMGQPPAPPEVRFLWEVFFRLHSLLWGH